MSGKPGILFKILKGLSRFKGLNKLKNLNLTLSFESLIFPFTIVRNNPVATAGNTITRRAISQPYKLAMLPPASPANAPPTGTPAMRIEKSVPHNLLGV